MNALPDHVALDNSNCIASAMHLGYTHYVDLCSNRVSDIPWGGGDWALFVGLSAFGFAVVVAMLGIGVSMWRDM